MNRFRAWWVRHKHRRLLRAHARWTAQTLGLIATADPRRARVLTQRVAAIINGAERTGEVRDALIEVSDMLLANLQEVQDAMEAGEEIVSA